MTDSADSAAVEREFQKLTLSELQHQRSSYRSRIQQLQNEISNLAFNNYRTYADVGRTAEHCKEMFTEVNQFMTQVKREFPSLVEGVETFRANSTKINAEFSTLDEINSINCYVWELLKLPKMMDKCIRAGKYETAYALTNFAVNIKQSKLMQNPMIKEVVDVLIEARHGLLDELFNKFAGPIDLAKSIQVVNNIRKIPYISNTQLRVSILQYRDVYLEKNVLNIMSEPDFLPRVIEVYRDCMYDTIVLYMAVFPSSADFQRKYVSSLTADDSRWERWTGGSQTYLLQSWAHRNIERLFGFLRSMEAKSAMDVETMAGKLMSFAFSFGRMGLDFRSLVLHEFGQLIVDGFRRKVADAVKSLLDIKRLDLVDGDIFESTLSELETSGGADLGVLSAPLELCVWDDVCRFGNQIIEALNEARHLLSVNYVNQMFKVLKLALQDLFKWLADRFLKKSDKSEGGDKDGGGADAGGQITEVEAAKVRRATKLLLQHFVPFLNKCFFNCFPYDKCCRPLFRGRFPQERYVECYSFLSADLFSHCKNAEFFKQIYEELKQAPPTFTRAQSSSPTHTTIPSSNDGEKALSNDVEKALSNDVEEEKDVELLSKAEETDGELLEVEETIQHGEEDVEAQPMARTKANESAEKEKVVGEGDRGGIEDELEQLLRDTA